MAPNRLRYRGGVRQTQGFITLTSGLRNAFFCPAHLRRATDRARVSVFYQALQP